MPSRTWIALLSLAGFVLACQPAAEEPDATTEPAVDVAAEEQALRDLADQYEQAISSGQADAVIALYTPDAIEIAHDGTAQPAAEAVRTMMGETPAGSTATIAPERTTVASSGDIAYETGTFSLSTIGPDSQPMTMTQRYLVTFKKVDGAWRADVVMGSAPLAEGATAETTTP